MTNCSAGHSKCTCTVIDTMREIRGCCMYTQPSMILEFEYGPARIKNIRTGLMCVFTIPLDFTGEYRRKSVHQIHQDPAVITIRGITIATCKNGHLVDIKFVLAYDGISVKLKCKTKDT